MSTGELSSCHAALTTAECDSASEPAGDERASDSVGVGGTNLMPRLRPMVCVAAGAGAVVVERHAGDGGAARARWQFHGGRQGVMFATVAPLVGYVDRRNLWAERRARASGREIAVARGAAGTHLAHEFQSARAGRRCTGLRSDSRTTLDSPEMPARSMPGLGQATGVSADRRPSGR